MSALTNRFDIVYLFDCQDGNPNGDPDAGNMPRADPETLQGLVSDVCQKRKVRDWVYQTRLGEKGPAAGYDIFFGHSGLPERQILNRQIEDAHKAVMNDEALKQLEKAKSEDDRKKVAAGTVNEARRELCRTRFDIRTFGAVLSTGLNAGQVRGPVQCTFARSIDPIFALEAAITRKAVAKEEDARKQIADDGSITGTMGRKNLIPYGLYRSHWFVSPHLADQTGFSREDMRVLCDALVNMWELDRSAARGLMAARAVIVFQHQSKLGNARAHDLFARVAVARKSNGKPPRAFDDYTVAIDRDGLPAGVGVTNLVEPEDYKRFMQTLGT